MVFFRGRGGGEEVVSGGFFYFKIFLSRSLSTRVVQLLLALCFIWLRNLHTDNHLFVNCLINWFLHKYGNGGSSRSRMVIW